MTDKSFWKPKQMLEAIAKDLKVSDPQILTCDDVGRLELPFYYRDRLIVLKMTTTDPIKFAASIAMDEPIKQWPDVNISILVRGLKGNSTLTDSSQWRHLHRPGQSPKKLPNMDGSVDVFNMKTALGLKTRVVKTVDNIVDSIELDPHGLFEHAVFAQLDIYSRETSGAGAKFYRFFEGSKLMSPCGKYKYEVICRCSKPQVFRTFVGGDEDDIDDLNLWKCKFTPQSFDFYLNFRGKDKKGKWKTYGDTALKSDHNRGEWLIPRIDNYRESVKVPIKLTKKILAYDFADHNERDWNPATLGKLLLLKEDEKKKREKDR